MLFKKGLVTMLFSGNCALLSLPIFAPCQTHRRWGTTYFHFCEWGDRNIKSDSEQSNKEKGCWDMTHFHIKRPTLHCPQLKKRHIVFYFTISFSPKCNLMARLSSILITKQFKNLSTILLNQDATTAAPVSMTLGSVPSLQDNKPLPVKPNTFSWHTIVT